jgi:hypothetical protein
MVLALSADAPAPVYLLVLTGGVALLLKQRPILEFAAQASRQFYLHRLPRPLYLGWLWLFRLALIVIAAGWVLAGALGFVVALFGPF